MIVSPPPADKTNGDIIEEHVHSGSSTSKRALEEWMSGGVYVKPTRETFDYIECQLPDGSTVRGGDTVAKTSNGTFFVKSQPKDFTQNLIEQISRHL
ncbi:hypothetical protein ACGE24_07890 [Corynebacterium kroppenstedtii]|uniref:hypothetical protein n=1 Tax=Corynebacterium sp. PCR 32 TaxID=3351342 RepID=UPI0030AB24BC